MNGPLYILDKKTNSLRSIWTSTGATTGRASSIGSSLRAATATASTGSISIPTTGATGSSTRCTWRIRTYRCRTFPDAKNHPGLNLTRYTTTQTIDTPGDTINEGVLIEWTDTNPSNDVIRRHRP